MDDSRPIDSFPVRRNAQFSHHIFNKGYTGPFENYIRAEPAVSHVNMETRRTVTHHRLCFHVPLNL